MIDIKSLNNVEIFNNFSEDELKVFFKNADEYEVRPGELLFHEGETGSEMFVILNGEIEIYKEKGLDDPQLLVSLPEGAFFGEMSLIDSSPRSAMAKAGETTVKMAVFSRAFIEALVRQNNLEIATKFMLNVIKYLAQRNRMTTERLIYSRQTLDNIKN
ncbi:MAG: hypothetical protein C0601_04145 [Candidatus Muiribacterium halophilum]|uniref:Cyclic nucleotide-binding domain-containing protein n=1 Tax=Muiribacterium halophilum TaxID=2053465 RepID=A0A2N5ZJ40_MUIH1|nr:MAG: hypothetical protein C0601_04145 [Candidatus Muirbacterium halophilum]